MYMDLNVIKVWMISHLRTNKDVYMCVADVDMGDSGSMDSGRPDTPDTDESSEVSTLLAFVVAGAFCIYVY